MLHAVVEIEVMRSALLGITVADFTLVGKWTARQRRLEEWRCGLLCKVYQGY